MAETAMNMTIGAILSGIGYIGLSIEEYNLKNEKILELQREIQMITPFIQNMQTSSLQIGIHGRLQKLAVLLQQIKSWIVEIGQMSKLKHFIFAISHTKQISKFHAEIKEIKIELGFEMRVGNFHSQAKLNQQMDDLLQSLKKTDDCEKIKLLFDTQRELNDARLEAITENFQQTLNSLIGQHNDELEQLYMRIENLEKRDPENIPSTMVEHQKLLLENQRVELEMIRAKNYTLELDLISKGKLEKSITPEMIEYSRIQLEKLQLENQMIQSDSNRKPTHPAAFTCTCSPETSENSEKYPYFATFCSQGCRGKKTSIILENKEYYIQRIKELCESIPLDRQSEYEKFICYIESGNFDAEHIIYLLEYEMEQKRLQEEKSYKRAAIELQLAQAREQYNHLFSVYRRHLVQCVGEEKSHGSMSLYANESWYAEHCRLWQIQSNAQTLVHSLERQLAEINI